MQLIWKETRSIGVSFALGMDATGKQLCTHVVVLYKPGASFDTKQIEQNVKPGSFDPKVHCKNLLNQGGESTTLQTGDAVSLQTPGKVVPSPNQGLTQTQSPSNTALPAAAAGSTVLTGVAPKPPTQIQLPQANILPSTSRPVLSGKPPSSPIQGKPPKIQLPPGKAPLTGVPLKTISGPTLGTPQQPSTAKVAPQTGGSQQTKPQLSNVATTTASNPNTGTPQSLPLTGPQSTSTGSPQTAAPSGNSAQTPATTPPITKPSLPSLPTATTPPKVPSNSNQGVPSNVQPGAPQLQKVKQPGQTSTPSTVSSTSNLAVPPSVTPLAKGKPQITGALSKPGSPTANGALIPSTGASGTSKGKSVFTPTASQSM